MVLKLELREDQEQRLREIAKERGISVDELMREAIDALVSRVPDSEFRRHLNASVKQNEELLRRLA
jgi:hypothetical protein